ncbi:hypothetical protein ACWZHB_20150 [Nocardia sp. FBN12]|uniref:hypothetical protein n=1 Tax=Nocardia sp. FBN12 TaxID=3419766 RepID=UPI003D070825
MTSLFPATTRSDLVRWSGRTPRYWTQPGELKAGGKRGTQWRLYFGEPINHRALVVGVALRDSKRAKLSVVQNRSRQRQHITQAMRFLKTYFRSQGYCWAPFPRGPK